MELSLTLHVVVVLLSFDANIVVFAKVNLGWSFRILILKEHGAGGDSSLLNSICSHKNEH